MSGQRKSGPRHAKRQANPHPILNSRLKIVNPKAVTLIELLAMVSIGVLLAAILLPWLGEFQR